MKKSKLKLRILIFLLPIFAILTVLFLFLYVKTQSELAKIKSQKDRGSNDVKKLISEVEKIVLLPSDETPTVATVSDVEKLKSSQLFFAKAQNGDKVLIFSNAKKAILYRPSIRKIIEVAPVNLGSPSASIQSNSSTISPTKKLEVRVAIYNGSKIAGLAAAAEKDLKEKLPFVNVVLKDNSTGDFLKTTVVDLKGNKKDLANQIAKAVSGEVSSLPTGEKQPDADILVIVVK